jgi:hypothetical protein
MKTEKFRIKKKSGEMLPGTYAVFLTETVNGTVNISYISPVMRAGGIEVEGSFFIEDSREKAINFITGYLATNYSGSILVPYE